MWSRERGVFLTALLSSACSGAHATQPATLPSARQVVAKYCVSCHSPNGAAADFDWSNERSLVLHRRNIAAKVEQNSMPPPGLPRPNADERRVLSCWAAPHGTGCQQH